MERERKVHPDCVNASNPFHQCADRCQNRSQNPNLKINGSKSPVGNGERAKSPVGNGERVNINTNCVNASNPFHRCGDYCSKKAGDVKKLNGTGKLAQNRELSNGVRKMEARNVNPSCANASNPFHQCTEYCSQGTSGAKRSLIHV